MCLYDAFVCLFVVCVCVSLVQEHKFYDKLIIGGGDNLLFQAMLGVFKKSLRDNLSENIRRQIESWASAVYKATQGRFGYTDGIALTMFHGTRDNRKYKRRYDVLKDNDFDPVKDISVSESGVWQWSSDKPKLHRCGYGYVTNNREH